MNRRDFFRVTGIAAVATALSITQIEEPVVEVGPGRMIWIEPIYYDGPDKESLWYQPETSEIYIKQGMG